LYRPRGTLALSWKLFSAECIFYLRFRLYTLRSRGGLIYFTRSTRIREKPRRLWVYERATSSESRLEVCEGSYEKAKCRPRATVATHRCAVWKLSMLVLLQFTISRTGPQPKLSTPPTRYTPTISRDINDNQRPFTLILTAMYRYLRIIDFCNRRQDSHISDRRARAAKWGSTPPLLLPLTLALVPRYHMTGCPGCSCSRGLLLL